MAKTINSIYIKRQDDNTIYWLRKKRIESTRPIQALQFNCVHVNVNASLGLSWGEAVRLSRLLANVMLNANQIVISFIISFIPLIKTLYTYFFHAVVFERWFGCTRLKPFFLMLMDFSFPRISSFFNECIRFGIYLNRINRFVLTQPMQKERRREGEYEQFTEFMANKHICCSIGCMYRYICFVNEKKSNVVELQRELNRAFIAFDVNKQTKMWTMKK